MRLLYAITLVSAVGVWRACAPGSTPSHPTAQAPRLALADLIPADTSTVLASRPDQFPFAAAFGGHGPSAEPCWQDLERRVTRAYQVMRGAGGERSVTILAGDLSREAVESCVRWVFGGFGQVAVTSLGDRSSIEIAGIGRVFVAWRGPYVIVGARKDVDAALAGGGGPRWRDRLVALEAGSLAVTTDHPLVRLLDDAATSVDVVIDAPDRGPLGPQARAHPAAITGRIVVHCADPVAAQAAARRITARLADLPDDVPRGVGGALARLRAEPRGATVVAAFDGALLAALDLPELAELATAVLGAADLEI